MCNMMKHKVRKCLGKTYDDDEVFTPWGRKKIDELKTWNWASVLTKICLLGELFFTFQVGIAKATYIFISWLNSPHILGSLQYAVVILVVFGIGFSMLNATPVPGMPVYVFTGIVIAEQGRKLESVGFAAGCLIACLVALALKLVGCIVKYGIGYLLGNDLRFQVLIGVDKVPIRAIEKILSEPGLSIGKVSILVGGPDWPTSVTCGILKLNLPQMLLGTLPMFFVSSPCVLAGAFLGRVSVGEESIWSALADTFTALAVACQAGCGFMAVNCITQVIEKHHEELSEWREEHREVSLLTKKQQHAAEIYNRLTDFGGDLSFRRRATICCAAALQLLSGVIFAMGSGYCFRPFSLSSNIDDLYEENGLRKPGDTKGHPKNIVLDLAWLALFFFAVGTILHIIFIKDMARMAAAEMAREPKEEQESHPPQATP